MNFLQALTSHAQGSATAAANTAVVITLAATAGKFWIIPGLIYSYSDLPGAVGGITVSDGVNSLDWDYLSSGSEQRNFSPHWRGGSGRAVTITLKAGGAGVVGKLNIAPAPYQQG